ncbi:hypothetical protein C5Y93_13575 [Blastopirellula marina]|uniref:Uncharacterized protein n=1 Tax=Blastopirellula marina TaxID=124 RepID=A0A2S8GM08_9BACT|nr:hypothetical protein C5Y93_13575 [Blastopirellula marina]
MHTGVARLQLDVPFSSEVAIYRNAKKPELTDDQFLGSCEIGNDCSSCLPSESAAYLVQSRGQHRHLVLTEVPELSYEWALVHVVQWVEQRGCRTKKLCCTRPVRLKANDLKYVRVSNCDLAEETAEEPTLAQSEEA